VLLNLGGGYQEFIDLARTMGIPDASSWVLGRPAAHPMTELSDYFRTADVLVQGSLEEGLGLSPLEALACETPVIATAVGGMAAHLGDYVALTPRRDADAMARALKAIATDQKAARAWARRGRDYVCREWSREKAFRELHRSLSSVARRTGNHEPSEEAAA
jgi:glycosyltransferase involved in cell wall biosynthesis